MMPGMKSSARPGTLAAVLAAALTFLAPVATHAAEAPESVTVPLRVIRLPGGAHKVGIEVGLGGGPKRLYELDTGASGLYAAYNEQWWPSFEKLPDAPITQSYASGVTYVSDRVRTQIAIPSDHGDVVADLEVARITDGYGGPLGPQDDSTWNADVAAGKPPLYDHFYGDFGADLRKKNGIASILPQLPGNLSSGFIVELGCDRADGPRLILGLTDANRARFTTRVAMQPGNGDVFPTTGLPTYAQALLAVDLELSRRGVVQSFSTDALLDTGGPTTNIYETEAREIDRTLVDRAKGVLKPATYVSVFAEGLAKGNFELAFLAGRVSGRDEVKVTSGDSDNVNLGLIPFFRYDVMFDVENGVVGFTPCRNGGDRRLLPVIDRTSPR